jgi:hypothetical protein
MQIFWWILGILGLLFLAYLVATVYLAMVLRWEDEQTVGLNYYGRSAADRAAFKQQLRAKAQRLGPILRMMSKTKLDLRKARIQYKGVSGPTGSCSVETFQRGADYKPRAEDVFVVTQMKCGTTWMQNIVYEVLNRGAGTLVETGATLYSVSPWLEGRKSVSLEEAPLIGRERPGRIIKTHFPAQLCPLAADARYIYVARHPVSCFASCIDFVVTNVGEMAPDLPAFEEWFCSPDLMWWGTWTDHVKGWWEKSQQNQNVLFVYFEEMKRDLPRVIRQVAAFLGVAPLSDGELSAVAEKTGFRYMQAHQDNFEMQPPHILQTNAQLFVSGTAERHKDVPVEARERIAEWAARELRGTDVLRAWPDILTQSR